LSIVEGVDVFCLGWNIWADFGGSK